ncbi:MAG: transposase [Gaiellales bacterium]|jgi:transposase|nr:transposase [Gaiellales bacterium]
MTDGICFVGLDVHARKTVAAAVQLGSGEVFKAQLPGSPAAALQWLATLPGPVCAVYEAGPTGFGLARAARAAGVQMMVCAPGAIPRQPGDGIKTDTRNALKLARLHAAGQLRPVVVPAPELEGLRDLVRAREDLRGDLMSARHRVGKLLLRRGLVWEGPGDAWSQRHLRWLGTIRFDDALVELVFGEYLAHHEVLLARRDRLDAILLEQSTQGSWAPTVARLRCMRGIDTLTAVGLVAEIGDITAFKHPKQLASYLGLVPSEHTSGNQTPPRRDHEGRQLSRPPAARRGRLALPTATPRLRDAQAPPGRPASGCDRRGCIAAGRTSTRRARRSAPPSLSRSRASSRASSGRSHDNPTDPRSPSRSGGGGGGRRRVTRDPR